MNRQRCEKYAHCRLRGDRERAPYCEGYCRPRYIRDYPDGHLPLEACLELATRNNGHHTPNIAIGKNRT